MQNPRQYLGPALIGGFVLSQALRDVYLAQVFRSVDVFATILATFPLMALVFGGIALWRDRAGLARLRSFGGLVLAMNVTTALAWTSYFFALKFVQPSVLNALHSGFGPLTVVVLGARGRRARGTGQMEPAGRRLLRRASPPAWRFSGGSCCRANPAASTIRSLQRPAAFSRSR